MPTNFSASKRVTFWPEMDVRVLLLECSNGVVKYGKLLWSGFQPLHRNFRYTRGK